MRFLSFLLSLLLAIGVVVFFLRPWEQEPAKTSPEVIAVEPPPPSLPSAPAPAPERSAEGERAEAPGAAPAADPSRRLLAREQAEREREAALEKKEEASTPAPITKRYFRVKVRDAGTLEARGRKGKALLIRLAGIESHDAEEICDRSDGSKWPCGARARTALTQFIRYRSVSCTLPEGGETEEFTARCEIQGQDLSTWLVRQGWATPVSDSRQELADALAEAKADKAGLWSEN